MSLLLTLSCLVVVVLCAENSPAGKRAWGPGDLNRFFKGLVANPIYQNNNNVKVLWSPEKPLNEEPGPWVVAIDDFLSADECEHVIAVADKIGFSRSKDVSYETLKVHGSHGTYANEDQTMTTATCSDEDCMQDPIAVGIMDRIEKLAGIPANNMEHLQFAKYEETQKYTQHHYYIDFHNQRPYGARILNVFLFLNDVEAGGTTRFPLLDMTVKAKRGRALIWPNVLDNDPDEEDPRLDIESLPVEAGTKYEMNVWIHQRDFMTPYQNDVLTGVPKKYQGHAEDQEWFHVLQACMDEKSAERRESSNKTQRVPPPEPYISVLYPSKDEPLMATVAFALSEEEAENVVDLSHCLKQHHPDTFEHRSFADAYESEEQTGGNDCLYLGGFFQLLVPGAAAQLCRAERKVWEAAGWAYMQDEEGNFLYGDPCEIGIRTVEHLSYSHSGWRHLGKHQDFGTVYTVVVPLNEEYEGGEFFLEPVNWADSKGRIVIKPNKLTAVMFFGEEHHGVQPLVGTREVLAIETWNYGDAPVGIRRPQVPEYEDFLESGTLHLYNTPLKDDDRDEL